MRYPANPYNKCFMTIVGNRTPNSQNLELRFIPCNRKIKQLCIRYDFVQTKIFSIELLTVFAPAIHLILVFYKADDSFSERLCIPRGCSKPCLIDKLVHELRKFPFYEPLERLKFPGRIATNLGFIVRRLRGDWKA